MQKTVLADGTPFQFPLGDRAGFTSHRCEMGIFAGQYGGATLVSGYGVGVLQLAAGARGGRSASSSASSPTASPAISVLTHVFVPEARWSPFLTLGLGLVRIEPKATLVQAADRTEQTAYVGGGVRYYLTRRFFLRAEYKAHYVFTKRNENEEADEWKLGLRILLLTRGARHAARLRHGAPLVPPRPRRPPSAPQAAGSRGQAAPPRVIEPEVARRKIKVPKIRSRNVEMGLYYGVLSIEDFGTNPVYGITAAYHITEDFFFQGECGPLQGRATPASRP